MAEARNDASDLPYVDQHAVTIDAPPAVVWAALEGFVGELDDATGRTVLRAVLATRGMLHAVRRRSVGVT